MSHRKEPTRAWQRMLSGRRLDLLDPSPLDIEIADIAHGLARVARWNGQTEGDHAFSVAQHSVLVLNIFAKLDFEATAADQLMALLHDASEYVVGDMISPFKAVVGGDYKALEDRLLNAVHLRFGLPASSSPELKRKIKKADTIAAYFEATQLAGFSDNEAIKYFGRPRGFTPDDFDLLPQSAKAANQSFLCEFNRLEKSLAISA